MLKWWHIAWRRDLFFFSYEKVGDGSQCEMSSPLSQSKNEKETSHPITRRSKLKKNHSMEILLQECVLSPIHASKLKNMLLYDKAKRRSVMSVTYETNDWQLFPYDVNRTDSVNTSLVGRVGLITRSVEFVILMLYINLSHSHLFHTSFMARLSYLSFSVMCELLFSC